MSLPRFVTGPMISVSTAIARIAVNMAEEHRNNSPAEAEEDEIPLLDIRRKWETSSLFPASSPAGPSAPAPSSHRSLSPEPSFPAPSPHRSPSPEPSFPAPSRHRSLSPELSSPTSSPIDIKCEPSSLKKPDDESPEKLESPESPSTDILPTTSSLHAESSLPKKNIQNADYDGGVYTGPWDEENERPNGKGSFVFKGATYKGTWENGVPCDGARNTWEIIYKTDDGISSIYEGEIKDFERQGRGKLVQFYYKNGVVVQEKQDDYYADGSSRQKISMFSAKEGLNSQDVFIQEISSAADGRLVDINWEVKQDSNHLIMSKGQSEMYAEYNNSLDGDFMEVTVQKELELVGYDSSKHDEYFKKFLSLYDTHVGKGGISKNNTSKLRLLLTATDKCFANPQ